jgi:hypothetical protein
MLSETVVSLIITVVIKEKAGHTGPAFLELEASDLIATPTEIATVARFLA